MSYRFYLTFYIINQPNETAIAYLPQASNYARYFWENGHYKMALKHE